MKYQSFLVAAMLVLAFGIGLTDPDTPENATMLALLIGLFVGWSVGGLIAIWGSASTWRDYDR